MAIATARGCAETRLIYSEIGMSDSVENDDEAILSEVARGNASSYLVLSRRYGRKLCNLLYWWLGDWLVAETTARDALVKLFEEAAEGAYVQTEATCRAELFRRAALEGARRLRLQRGLPEPSEDAFFEDEEALLTELIEGHAAKPPTAVPERHAANYPVEESLLRMKGEQRLALLLKACCGFSYAETGWVMGRPADEIRQWVFWGRRKMGAVATHLN